MNEISQSITNENSRFITHKTQDNKNINKTESVSINQTDLSITL